MTTRITRAAGPANLPRVGPLVDVHYLAKRFQRGYRSTLHLLNRLIEGDKRVPLRPEQVWWIGFGVHKAQKLANLFKLRAAHPALFAQNYVSREEHEDLLTRMARVEERVQLVHQRYKSLTSPSRPGRNRRPVVGIYPDLAAAKQVEDDILDHPLPAPVGAKRDIG